MPYIWHWQQFMAWTTLTWNCKHMANAQIQRNLAQISSDLGYELPIICTPYELMGYEVMGE